MTGLFQPSTQLSQQPPIQSWCGQVLVRQMASDTCYMPFNESCDPLGPKLCRSSVILARAGVLGRSPERGGPIPGHPPLVIYSFDETIQFSLSNLFGAIAM